ncbi:uncharacterized protein I303_101664 [Kwoniella dejecticola CBS 10117]
MTMNGRMIVSLGRFSARGSILPRGNVASLGSPLLLGPNGSTTEKASGASGVKADPNDSDNDNGKDDTTDDDGSNDSNADSTSLSASISSSTTTHTSVSSASTSTAQPGSTITSSSTKFTSSSSSSSSPSSTERNSLLPSDPPKQPSSIRYLVPVFLLILITLAGFGYQKYRKRRKRRNRSSMAAKDFERLMRKDEDPFADPDSSSNNRGGWKEIPTYDYNHDEEEGGIWDTKMDDDPPMVWQNMNNLNPEVEAGGESGLIRSGGLVSAGQKGWGWKESWNNFRSARGKDIQAQSGDIDVIEEERQTMKLVTSINLPSGPTYTNLPITIPEYEEISIDDEGETGAASKKNQNKLQRNKSPNKRASQTPMATPMNIPPAMPEAPEWIRPRSVSPTNNILSPPMQPHLFFHPTSPATRKNEPSMISEYSELDDGSVYTASIQGNTPVMPSQPSPNIEVDKPKSRFPRIPSSASKLAGIDSFSIVSNNKRTQSQSLAQTKTEGQTKTKGESKSKQYTPSGLSPLKRSTGLKNLKAPPGRTGANTLSPESAVAADVERRKSTRKSRVEKKEMKARNEVEDILKASWSDRALSSPSPPLSPTGSMNMNMNMNMNTNMNMAFAQHLGQKGMVPGLMSPGLEGGSGIEQRLALLREVQI